MSKNLLINKKIFNGISKISVRDADGVKRHIYEESGTVAEISTAEEMSNVISAENAGKIYKYVGESTSKYTNGQLYQISLVTTGENVVKIDTTKDFLWWPDDSAGFVMYSPFEHNFTDGQKVDFVYRADGVEKTVSLYYVEFDNDGTILQVLSNKPEVGDIVVLEDEDGDNELSVFCYLNIAPDVNMGLASGQCWVVEHSPYKVIEVVSIGGIKNPRVLKSQPIYGLTALATEPQASDIRENVACYDSKGNLVVGSMTNPIKVETEAEMDELLSTADWGSVFYYDGNTTSDKRYKCGNLYRKTNNGFELLQIIDERSDWATSADVVNGKSFVTSSGFHSGMMSEPREISDAEQLSDLMCNSHGERIFKYVGDDSIEYKKKRNI